MFSIYLAQTDIKSKCYVTFMDDLDSYSPSKSASRVGNCLRPLTSVIVQSTAFQVGECRNSSLSDVCYKDFILKVLNKQLYSLAFSLEFVASSNVL